ncbi:MAG: tRNA adenosine(34) deaminase TadA [Bdellovibrionales bacterium]
MSDHSSHFPFMTQALELAKKAEVFKEVPIGAVVVFENKIVGAGYNLRESQKHPLAHAEKIAIEEAAQKLGRWRLTGCTLYVTLEPCLMCAGAIINSRIEHVVYGAKDPKAGAVESLYQSLSDARLNHRPQVTGGVMAEECGQILSSFFASLRQSKN